MLIQLNDQYRVVSIPLNYVLQEKKVKQKGSEQGKEYYKDVGYYGNLEQLVYSLFNHRIQRSQIEGIQNIINEIKQAVHSVKHQIRRLESEVSNEGAKMEVEE